jgi:polyvinyl alcohol dehydrogenase (cytochrome)
MAFDLRDGHLLWSKQMTSADDWNTSCRLPDQINCTNREAPDFRLRLAADPRASAEWPPRARGRSEVRVWSTRLDPDRNGELIWQEARRQGWHQRRLCSGDRLPINRRCTWRCRISRGSRCRTARPPCPDPSTGGGMFALRLDSGQRKWYTPPPADACRGRERCSPAQSAAVSAIPGVVFSGAVDGHIRAFAAADGKIVWDFDTVKTYETVNGRRRSRRIAERRRAGDQRRDAVREFGLRAERHSWQCAARLFSRWKIASLVHSCHARNSATRSRRSLTVSSA